MAKTKLQELIDSLNKDQQEYLSDLADLRCSPNDIDEFNIYDIYTFGIDLGVRAGEEGLNIYPAHLPNGEVIFFLCDSEEELLFSLKEDNLAYFNAEFSNNREVEA